MPVTILSTIYTLYFNPRNSLLQLLLLFYKQRTEAQRASMTCPPGHMADSGLIYHLLSDPLLYILDCFLERDHYLHILS